jgi:hypothetical protein
MVVVLGMVGGSGNDISESSEGPVNSMMVMVKRVEAITAVVIVRNSNTWPGPGLAATGNLVEGVLHLTITTIAIAVTCITTGATTAAFKYYDHHGHYL